MRRLSLFIAIVFVSLSTFAQTGAEIINKYKGIENVSYFNTNTDDAKASLKDSENDIRTATKGVLDKSFVNKFFASVNGVKSMEFISIPRDSVNLLSNIKSDVRSLVGKGYNIITDQESSYGVNGTLSLSKIESGAITEIVILSPLEKKNIYILCDMKGKIEL